MTHVCGRFRFFPSLLIVQSIVMVGGGGGGFGM